MTGIQGKQCVKIRWRDTATHDGWLEFADAVENDFLVTTIGWVMHETDNTLTVSPSLADCKQAHGLITIPKGCIIERHYVPAVGVQALPTSRELTPDEMLTELDRFAINALADPDKLHQFRTMLGNMRTLLDMAPNFVQVPSPETRTRQLFEAMDDFLAGYAGLRHPEIQEHQPARVALRLIADAADVQYRPVEER